MEIFSMLFFFFLSILISAHLHCFRLKGNFAKCSAGLIMINLE